MNQNMTLSWVKVGGWCGLIGIAAYLLAAFAPLPDTLGFAAAFAFGPLLAISAMGLYHGLATHRNSPSLQIATVFAIGGGITVLIMLTTQQSIFEMMRIATEKVEPPDIKEQLQKLKAGLNAVHLGIDVAWDVLIATATILFGYHMLKHPAFGKIIGGLGMLFGTLLIVFNLIYFPIPPADANSIDWGPFVALWFVAVFVMLLRSVSWVREKSL